MKYYKSCLPTKHKIAGGAEANVNEIDHTGDIRLPNEDFRAAIAIELDNDDLVKWAK